LSAAERLDERLVRLGVVDDETLLKALAHQNGLPYVSLISGLGDRALSTLLDRDWSRSHGVLPLYRVHGELTVAVADPTDVFTRDALRRLTGLKLRFVVAHPDEIIRGLSQGKLGMKDFSVDNIIGEVGGEQDIQVVEEALEDDIDIEEVAGLSPVVKLVNVVIAKAIREGVSDIHIEPGEDILRVRFRVDGMLRESLRPPARMAPAIVSRVKIMSSLDIAERRAPQDGRMQVMLDGRGIDLRVSTLPTYHGEKVVIRILDRSAMMGDLTCLGLTPRVLEGLNDLVKRPNGVVLVTGPTGSGKTTTLYGCLASINSIDTNICTVENPTEYSLPMVNQVQVNERAGLTFSTALRSLLRQDPDVIMVGEIRDHETAKMAIEAALTGHLVFSTLHTNDAISAIPRLVNMGIEAYLLGAAMNGVLAQRRPDQVRSDADVDQARDGAGRVVRVQRREHEVPGQRCLHGDRRGLGVADLADHQHVRVLAQQRAQSVGEPEATLDVGLHLVDAAQVVFDGVLDGADVLAGFVDLVEGGVERRRLAAAGRAGDEDDAVGPVDQVLERLQPLVADAEVAQRDAQGSAVHDAQHDLLAVHGRQRRHAHVDRARVEPHAETAVLRLAAFADVEVRHDLEARHDGRVHARGGAHQFAQFAVDAVPDAQHVVVGLDVDVAGAVADGPEQDEVHEPHDRRHVGQFLEIERLVALLLDDLDLAFLDVADEVVDLERARTVVHEVVEQRVDAVGARDDELHLASRHARRFVDRPQVGGIVDGDGQRPVDLEHRNDVVRDDEVPGQQRQHVAVEQAARDAKEGQPVLDRQRLAQVLVGDEVQPQQGVAEALTGQAFVRSSCTAQIVVAGPAVALQDVAELLRRVEQGSRHVRSPF
jgi:type IV pilus assembly protein PilB